MCLALESTQRSDTGEALTGGALVSSQALYCTEPLGSQAGI